MRSLNSTAIALAAVLAGGAALAQEQQRAAQTDGCDVAWHDLDREIAQDPDLRAHFDRALLRDLRVMRDAAIHLEQYGHITACNEIGQAIFQIMQDPEQYAEAASERAEATETSPGPEFGEGASATAERQTAVRIDELGQIRIDQVIGADVRDEQDNSIGSVDDVVIGAQAEDGYLIVGFGGFLGLGEEYTAVPLDIATFAPEQGTVYLPIDEERLDQAQTFERGDTAWLQDDGWRQQNRELFAIN